MNFVKNIFQIIPQPAYNLQQVRYKWANHWMARDVKRRKIVTELAPTRLRINSMRRNNILPPEIREIADAEIKAMPNNSSPLQIHSRCVITSRPRGVVFRWRLSRIVFRHLADYNKLSGVQRAMW
ncbi:28S ribosomal protein S14, mitochondrial [Sitophilus oryzae]|uniref:28S ribosomal protein S14, mitochondrial n=1 Tax=Sitophilus oryzae TaxID=7048 RepID=A0A6J2XA64_SITOR|nr:28S ribosomal protein S14, mitochondrial [Sitophilus oryzae]